MANTENLQRCARDHEYAPGALEVARYAFLALSPARQRKAEEIYRTLLAEKMMPLRPE